MNKYELMFIVASDVSEEKREECGKITVLPVAPVFAEAIERIYGDRPISPLFL